MGVRERPVDWRELERLLVVLGFRLECQSGTAHAQWEHPCFRGERRLVTVSRHHSPFTRNLLKIDAHANGAEQSGAVSRVGG